MQTFATDPSFDVCAKHLDRQRLGKQRVETFQILNVLLNPTSKRGWRNHPACRQWSGCENKLVEYGLAICGEWIRRGYKDTMTERIRAFYDPSRHCDFPKWWGTPDFHASHRSALLLKNPTWYSQFGWSELPQYAYWWPTEHGY